MAKHPHAAYNPQPHKRPTFNQIVEAAKKPRIEIDPDRYWKVRPSWRLGRAEMVDPWGWHVLSAKEAMYVREKLGWFETRTWSDILIVSKKQHHGVKFDGLTPEGQKRWKYIGLFVEEVVSLKLSGLERVIGLLEEGVFSVLWWDPLHQVCKTTKKNT